LKLLKRFHSLLRRPFRGFNWLTRKTLHAGY
jgi:hypothetical protein